MSKHLGTKQTLDLLERLKDTVRDFASREEKLAHELASKTAAARQQRDRAIVNSDQQLTTALADLETQLTSGKLAIETIFQRRKTRIRKANKTSKKHALDRIDDLEGRKKYKLQVETIRIEKKKKADIEAAEKAFEDFDKQLAVHDETLFELETKAKRAFAGFGTFRRLLATPSKAANGAMDEYQLATELPGLLKTAAADLSRFSRIPLPFLFRFRIILAVLIVSQLGVVPLLQHLGKSGFSYREAGISVVACFVLGFVLHVIAKKQAAPLATKLAETLTRARADHDICWKLAEGRRLNEIDQAESEFKAETSAITEQWRQVLEEAVAARECSPQKIDQKEFRAAAHNEKMYRARLEKTDQTHARRLEELQAEAEVRKRDAEKTFESQQSKINASHATETEKLRSEWKAKLDEFRAAIASINQKASEAFPPWPAILKGDWKPPQNFEHAAKAGEFQVDLPKFSGAVPKHPDLALGDLATVSLPFLLQYPNEGSLLFETSDSREQVVDTLNNVILRLLSIAPPGRLNFTIIDPVGLGQNFAGVMHLADYAAHLISNRIWTQSNQIEQKLGDLNDHMEKVIQMYLRNEYSTIAEYNEQAGTIAEKYHFLVVAGFPANFSDTAMRRLISIASSGARCGVYTLIHWDRAQQLPPDFNIDELKKSSVCLMSKGGVVTLNGRAVPGFNIALETPPAPEASSDFIRKVGQSNRDSNRIEVPFAHVTPPDSELWSVDTTTELRVPIGRTGATKMQYLALGKGTRQHALLAGKTGSGKSTLFHVIVTNLALWCSPEQVEFYLVDFKKGVEFKCYATNRLPHARVIAIESDREFGLSVLQKVDDELKRRGELFRELGVQDLAGYKRAGGKEALPRTLLMIDEFQEFFVEEDKVSQGASVLLDRIVRQGRAFGIHVLLGSQTLGGAYAMSRTTMGQMVVRIALQCNEADAYLIMDENNPAPRLLTRPGEGIYNDAAGAREGNSPFQTVWLPDEVRDTYLQKVRSQAERTQTKMPLPIVFEGDAPADVRENVELSKALNSTPPTSTFAARLWLGAPNSIKGPTEAVFEKQSGNNLLIVGQRDEAVATMMAVSLVSLSAQFPNGGVRLIVFDSSTPDSGVRDMIERAASVVPQGVTLAKNSDAAEVMNDLSADLKTRSEDQDATNLPRTFLFIHDLQKFSRLRYEDDFSFSSDEGSAANPAMQLNKLICEGAALGIHVIITCDTYNNVNRFMSKKAFSEFEMRVLFQMSANDSASLIDNPKAGSLGLHRALFYNEQEGHLEVFRPYAPPGAAWFDAAAEKLSKAVAAR